MNLDNFYQKKTLCDLKNFGRKKLFSVVEVTKLSDLTVPIKDPDPYQREKRDLDPYQSEKQDPDP
jgi:hypothetical protein